MLEGRVIKSFQGLCSNSTITMGRLGLELSLCWGDYKYSNIIDFLFPFCKNRNQFIEGEEFFHIYYSITVLSNVFPQVFLFMLFKKRPLCFPYLLLQFKSFLFTFILYLKLWAGNIREQQKPKTTTLINFACNYEQYNRPSGTWPSLTKIQRCQLHDPNVFAWKGS